MARGVYIRLAGSLGEPRRMNVVTASLFEFNWRLKRRNEPIGVRCFLVPWQVA
jgi:hypothetical protein